MAEILSHTAVYMNAEYVKVGAAVGAADSARIAVTAVQIWINDDFVANLESFWVVLRDGFDDTGKFVADDSRVGYERVGTAECTDIRTADACSFDLD
jgi:hypothetical protein